jgi:hypothetical protein
MSDPQEALNDLQTETSRIQQEKLRLSEAVPGRQQAAQEHLARARAFYKKKEWARAFSEWDAVCAYLDESDPFRQRLALLRESHANLAKVQRELGEIKEILSKRSAPSAEEKKFVQQAHEAASTEVKKAYAHLGQQLRTERTPKILSFWWPVALAALLLALGFLGVSAQQSKMRRVLRSEVELNAQGLRLDLAALQAERDALLKKIGTMEADHRRQTAQLEGQNAGWRNAGREKIEELEMQLQEAEMKNEDLQKKIADRDRLIRTLSSR